MIGTRFSEDRGWGGSRQRQAGHSDTPPALCTLHDPALPASSRRARGKGDRQNVLHLQHLQAFGVSLACPTLSTGFLAGPMRLVAVAAEKEDYLLRVSVYNRGHVDASRSSIAPAWTVGSTVQTWRGIGLRSDKATKTHQQVIMAAAAGSTAYYWERRTGMTRSKRRHGLHSLQ